jgi:hypothetical protein
MNAQHFDPNPMSVQLPMFLFQIWHHSVPISGKQTRMLQESYNEGP